MFNCVFVEQENNGFISISFLLAVMIFRCFNGCLFKSSLDKQ